MGKKTNKADVAAMNEAISTQKEARDRIDAVQEPDYKMIEDYIREAAAENPDLMGFYEMIKRDPSALENMVSDPSLRSTQVKALESLKESGESGFTEEDMIKRKSLQREVSAGENARQSSILQQMAERGQSGAGAELAARLSSSQQSTQRASEAGDRLSTDAASARRQALMQASQAAGSLRQQDYGEQKNLASARDQIAQFNALNRQTTADRNLQLRQGAENQRSGQLQNMSGQLGNLQQQKFGNQMTKAGAYVNATSPISQMQSQNVAKSKGMMGTIGALGGAAVGAYFGGPAGASAGASAGGALGNAAEGSDSAFAEGGVKDVPAKKYGSLSEYRDLGYDYYGGETEMTPERAKSRNRELRDILSESGTAGISNGQFLGRVKLTGDEKLMLLQERLKTTNNDKFKKTLEKAIIKNIESGIQYADGGVKTSFSPSMNDYSAQYEKEQFKKRELEDTYGGDRYQQGIMGKPGISTGDAFNSAKQGFSDLGDRIKGLIGSDNSKPEASIDQPPNPTENKPTGMDLSSLKGLLPSGGSDENLSAPTPINTKPLIDTDVLGELRSQKLVAADGGVKDMAYNDGGMGTIIDSGEESYAGDELDDNINDGEMVLNLDMQDRINNKLLELKRLKSMQRTDTMVDNGQKSIDPDQQESLLAVARGEIDVSELPDERVVSEPTGGMGELLSLIRKSKRS